MSQNHEQTPADPTGGAEAEPGPEQRALENELYARADA
jgi:hypothetical protein